MREENVPSVDARYWAAIVVASLLGTSFGDFVSNTVELGFGGAALSVGAVLAGIFLAEHLLPWPSVPWYWGAVVFTRTAATDFGDFLSRTAQKHLSLCVSTSRPIEFRTRAVPNRTAAPWQRLELL